jgi:hypothetical protein
LDKSKHGTDTIIEFLLRRSLLSSYKNLGKAYSVELRLNTYKNLKVIE